ncbi:MAG: DUF2442 domain-containing protein [Rhodospirillaceae bacterium]|nr:DUF2442 domain-containing protein [Rhodospirillales bacterium]
MRRNIVAVTALEGTSLHIRFQDGIEGNINVADLVPFRGVFEPLSNHATFAQVRVNPDVGTVCWPNGADLDPYVLYSRITGAPLPGQPE